MRILEAYKQLNNTEKKYLENVTIHELIRNQSKINPSDIAVIDYTRKLTYGDLDKKSDYIANILLESGIEPGYPVAVILDRSIELIICIVAILKCGGIYVPIDMSYPKLRIKYIIDDTLCKTIIVPSFQYELQKDIVMDDKTILNMKQVMDSFVQYESSYNQYGRNFIYRNKDIVCDDDLAYILYTSGTTGKPKGVMVTHKAILNTLFWMSEKFHIDREDNIAFKTSISFTDSIWEIFFPLLNGAKICIINDHEVKDPKKLYLFLKDNNIAITQFVPSMLKVFLDFIEINNITNPLPNLKWIFNGGEHITVSIAKKFNSLLHITKIANIYGMTESAVYATCFIIDKNLGDNLESISIGKPIWNTKVYILNENNELCGIGQKGEICISGISLAKGYFNKPKLTRDKFISNIIENDTIYRTGDIGALCSDGNIAYFGRLDNQIKIRGSRVEICEVEKNILMFNGIEEAAVINKKDKFDENILICFLTNNINISKLRTFLLNRLPDYMIPQHFILVKKLPLTINNKVDKKKLQTLKINYKNIIKKNKLEDKIIEIWKEILNLDYFDINDDFFDIGGNSITAARLLIFLNKIGVNLKLDEIYTYNTVNKLLQYVRKNNLYE